MVFLARVGVLLWFALASQGSLVPRSPGFSHAATGARRGSAGEGRDRCTRSPMEKLDLPTQKA